MLSDIHYHVLRDCKSRFILSDLDQAPDPQRHKDLYDNYISFTDLLPNARDGKLYCGVTAYNNDILHRFDPVAGTFESLHYGHVAEPFEIKVHRSLVLADDGMIYGASACLHGLDQRLEAPGGALFNVDPTIGAIDKFAVPLKYDYIQTITYDQQRQLIYGQTYPVFRFFVYDLASGVCRDFDYMGSISHISALDDDGCFWSTWHQNKHYLYKYDPAVGDITYYHHGLPNGIAASGRMYFGAGPIDCMINGGDGYLYIGMCDGSLCRLEPRSANVEYLGKPTPASRLPALVIWHDELLLGVAGDEAGTSLFAYDRKARAFHVLGDMIDADSGLKLYRPHDLALMDDGQTAYVAETDVPDRSGYLWQCRITL